MLAVVVDDPVLGNAEHELIQGVGIIEVPNPLHGTYEHVLGQVFRRLVIAHVALDEEVDAAKVVLLQAYPCRLVHRLQPADVVGFDLHP